MQLEIGTELYAVAAACICNLYWVNGMFSHSVYVHFIQRKNVLKQPFKLCSVVAAAETWHLKGQILKIILQSQYFHNCRIFITCESCGFENRV